MRTLLAMVGKDLRRRLRAPLATVLLLLFPLIFSGLIALTCLCFAASYVRFMRQEVRA